MLIDAGLRSIKENNSCCRGLSAEAWALSDDLFCRCDQFLELFEIHFDNLDWAAIPAFTRQSTLEERHAELISRQCRRLDAPASLHVFPLKLERFGCRGILSVRRWGWLGGKGH